MTNLELIKTMRAGEQREVIINVEGNYILLIIRRHAPGFQIESVGGISDLNLAVQKWLQEESEK